MGSRDLSLVLLPGMMCDARLFAPQVEEIGAYIPVSVADFTTQSTIADMAKSVLDNAPETFALAGLSMGGIVAMEVLRQAPERITHLALLDTNPLAETDKVKAGRAPQIARAKGRELAAMMADTFIPRYHGVEECHLVSSVAMDMALDLGPLVFAQQSVALRDRPDQTETLKAHSPRTLILYGSEDKLCPPSRHELMAELMPHATVVRIDGAGHIPTLETPEVVNAALRNWLEI